MQAGFSETAGLQTSNVGTLLRFCQLIRIICLPFPIGVPGSVVGIATGYWLDGPGIESHYAFSRETERLCSERS